jgi:hypothetical protein
MKIPDFLRRPFYNKSEIQPDGPPQKIKIRPNEAEDGDSRIKPDEETHNEPVGFWHPELRKVRNRAFAKWAVTTAFLMAFILAVLSIYWGVFFQAENRLHHLLVYVVDMDGAAPYDNTGTQPFVGPTITQLVQQQLSSGKPTLGWGIRSGSDFDNDPLRVRQAVYNWDAWAAIIINPNASALLYEAVATGNTSYDPLGACQLVYQDSRDDTNWFDFMLPIISQFMTQAQSQVGQKWAGIVLQNANDGAALANIQAVPQAVNPAIGFSEFNLRPFYPYTAIPAVSIGLICKCLSSSVCLPGWVLTIKYRSHHHILLQLFLLHAHSHAVSQPERTPAAEVSPADRLALGCHAGGIFLPLPRLQLGLARLPDQLLEHESHHVGDAGYYG